MNFWLDVMNAGTLPYLLTELVAMAINYMVVANDNCQAEV